MPPPPGSVISVREGEMWSVITRTFSSHPFQCIHGAEQVCTFLTGELTWSFQLCCLLCSVFSILIPEFSWSHFTPWFFLVAPHPKGPGYRDIQGREPHCPQHHFCTKQTCILIKNKKPVFMAKTWYIQSYYINQLLILFLILNKGYLPEWKNREEDNLSSCISTRVIFETKSKKGNEKTP